MKINVVSFEATECSALRRLAEYVSDRAQTATEWGVAGALEVLKKKMPVETTLVDAVADTAMLQAVYAFAVGTNEEDHATAGLTDDESGAVWNLYTALRPIVAPGLTLPELAEAA